MGFVYMYTDTGNKSFLVVIVGKLLISKLAVRLELGNSVKNLHPSKWVFKLPCKVDLGRCKNAAMRFLLSNFTRLKFMNQLSNIIS